MWSPSWIVSASRTVYIDLVCARREKHLAAGNQEHPANKGWTGTVGGIQHRAEGSTVEFKKLRWSGKGAVFGGRASHTENISIWQETAWSVLCLHEFAIGIQREVRTRCPTPGLTRDIGRRVDRRMTARARGEDPAIRHEQGRPNFDGRSLHEIYRSRASRNPLIGGGDVLFRLGMCAAFCRKDCLIGKKRPSFFGAGVVLIGASGPAVGLGIEDGGAGIANRAEEQAAVRKHSAGSVADVVPAGRWSKAGPLIEDGIKDFSAIRIAARVAELAASHKDATVAEDCRCEIEARVRHFGLRTPGSVYVASLLVWSEAPPSLAARFLANHGAVREK